MAPRISFVIPVRNDARRLETCLRSILRNQETDCEIEIVVVDNGSTDASPEVAMRFGARLLVIEKASVSELRNRGARHATGTTLGFVDADNEIANDWVDAACRALEVEGVGAAGALYQPPTDGTWVQRAYGSLRGHTRGREDVTWLGSGNLAVSRQVFEAVNGFDTSLATCEDVDLCNRIRAAGLRIVGDARIASVHHGDPKTLGELFRSELWRGRDNLRVSFRRPLFWSALPSALLPVVDLVLLGTALAGVLGWLTTWSSGGSIAISALFLIAAAASLKVLRAAATEKQMPGGRIVEAFIAACVYDVARALALITRAPHRGVQSRAATAPS
jgi:glycosyltransferase involved in cell wall biosynthesis